MPGGRLVYPCAGAVVSLFKGYDAGYKGLIPPYIVLTEPQGRFSQAGFLGHATSRLRPAATRRRRPSRWKASSRRASPSSAKRTGANCSTNLNTLDHAMPSDAQLAASRQAEQQAYDMILGDSAKVFDLSQEKHGTARPVRPQQIRPIVPGGAAPG